MDYEVAPQVVFRCVVIFRGVTEDFLLNKDPEAIRNKLSTRNQLEPNDAILEIVPEEEEKIDYEVLGTRLEDGTKINMLAERRYPLTKNTLERMMDLRLTVVSDDDTVFDLLRFIKQQIDEFGVPS
ncbi:hypothetical protein Tco_1166765 [Tanacetum coccineum]